MEHVMFEYLVIVLVGMIFGSFTTVLAYRIPRDIPLGLVKKTRSECPHCHRVIPLKWNIPLVSYLWLKGKCGYCGGEIPPRYFWIEVTTTLGFVVTYTVYSFSAHPPLGDFAWWAELVKLLWFTVSLVALIFIDLEFRIIPDRFSIGNWVIALAAAVLWQSPEPIESVLGCVMGFGLFWLMSWGYEKLKKQEGLGFGDVKMMGWLGAWVGFERVPFIILVASFTGLIVGVLTMRRKGTGLQTAIPFGPFLALAGYAAWILVALDRW